MAQDHHVIVPRLILARGKRPPHLRSNPEHAEVIRRHGRIPNRLRLPTPCARLCQSCKVRRAILIRRRHRRKRPRIPAPRQIIRRRHRTRVRLKARVGIHRRHHHHLLRLPPRQSRQQECAHQAEHRRVHCDPQRQRQHCRYCEPRRLHQLPQRKLYIRPHALRRRPLPHFPAPLLDPRHIPKLPPSRKLSLLTRHPPIHQLLNLLREVLPHRLRKLLIPPPPRNNLSKPGHPIPLNALSMLGSIRLPVTCNLPFHSSRISRAGSIRRVCRAGIHIAASPSTPIVRTTPPSTTGSPGVAS